MSEAPAVTEESVEEDAKLVYWAMWNEAETQGQVILDAIDAYTNATGVDIEVNFNGRDVQRQTLEPALAAGQTIDLFDEDIERVLNVWGDYLLDLTPFVNASYDDIGGNTYRSMVSPTLLGLAEELGGGAVKNIPYQPSTFVVQYNKDLFTAAGVTTLPKTWDEFLAVCEQLKASGVTPMTVDNAYMGCYIGYTLNRLVGMEKTNEMVKNLDFTDPAVLKAAEIWKDMIDKGYLSQKAATNIYPAGQVEEFAPGTAAMYLNGTWLPNEIASMAPDLNFGQFAFPDCDPAAGDGIEANNYGAQSYGINKNTAYPDAAFAFVRWMTVGEWDQQLATRTVGVPMGNDSIWPPQNAEAKVIIDATTKRMNWANGMEDVPELNAAIMDGLAKMITGEFTAQQFADALAAL
jgi:raffinose/stachyose/melibiose transport system substrate-binding protein